MVTRNPTHALDEPVTDHPLTTTEPVAPVAHAAPDPDNSARGLSRFWEATDALPGLSTTLPDWRLRLGAEYDLVLPFLQPRPDRSHAPTGPRQCGPDYEVDRPALAEAVAGALGLRRDKSRDSVDLAVAHLGQYASTAGSRYECFLTFAQTPEEAAVQAVRLRGGAGAPLFLLCTRGRVGATADPDLRRGDCLLAPLASTVRASGPGRLCAAHPLEVSADWASRAPLTPAGRPRNSISRSGEAWSVTFDGRTVCLGDRIGLWYIARLIQAKRREFPASELRDLVRGRVSPTPFKGVEAVDRAAGGEQERACRELTADIERARSNNDLRQTEALQGELHALAELARKEKGLKGRARRLGDESTSVRTSIKNAIDLVIEKICPEHPDLARHFEVFIQTGARLCYDPNPDVQWEV
jgi:hypothetical protein